MDTKKIQTLDTALVQASQKIKVLQALQWPSGLEEKFLQGWRQGNPMLPEISLPRQNYDDNVRALEDIAAQCNPEDPAEKFLGDTAQSYAYCGRMLNAIGTPDFSTYSSRIYGRPDAIYKLQGLSAVDGAKYFLSVTDALLGNADFPAATADISAEEFAGWLKAEVDEFFEHDVVEVVIDQSMSSKALAGATRIRIRGNAQFSQLDKDQLLFHEAFVHTATILNGKKQTNLKSLGLGAPRTTRTQEGIAVLAELVTNAMDINRLRRVALRVLAVKKALDGADFIEVFKFFLESGQSEEESVRSAQRIFRGGHVKGGIAFTKDAVYLQGLLEVHTFMRMAIRDNRPELIQYMFAGRLTLADTLRLTPLFKSGWLQPPAYMPAWAADLRRISASLAYSAFVSFIKLEKVYLERAIEIEEELKHQPEFL
ncbi:MAG TPA: flavohemoglobin expression-modulating QEGLA motif protein [Chryseolinea sp.]|nr:flavohemoglobin expression-modulating QEGLA motif protein [Chryseolinea sp.]